MAGTWYALRTSLRRRWLSYLLLVVLLAAGGGASLAAVAGARRTVAAYPRYLRASKASDVSLDAPELGSPAVRKRLARLPGVSRAASYQGFYAAPLDAKGKADPGYSAEALGSVDGRYFDQDRVIIIEGRLAKQGRADELVVNRVAADVYRYKVGQVLRWGVVTQKELENNFEDPHITVTKPMTVVGIARFNDEIIQDEIDQSAYILLTPAFVREHRAAGTYVWTGLRLAGGKRAVPGILKAARKIGVDAPFVRVAADTTERAQRAVRPLAWSLALFGLAAGLAVVVFAGQVLVRQVHLAADDHPMMRAIGMRPAGIAAVDLGGGVAATSLGVLAAVGVAAALSPLAPVGPVRAVEPSPGVALDAVVLSLGALLLLVLVVVQPVLTAWRLQRVSAPDVRPSGLVAALARSGAPVSAVAGARFALEPGRGRTSVPIRTTLLSAVIAIIALTAALTWGSSLRSLVGEPRLYGWGWDTTMYIGGGYGGEDEAGGNVKSFRPLLDKDPAVQDWAGMDFQSVPVGGKSLAVMGVVRGKGEVVPPLTGGQGLSTRNIFLGKRTLNELHKKVGDSVTLGTGKTQRTLRIDGEAVFPTLGVLHGDRVSLGSGALVDRDVLAAVVKEKGAADAGAFVVRFKPGADKAAGVRRLRAFAQSHPEQVVDAVFTGPRRPADIVNFREMGVAPTIMAVLFGLVALGALANALVTSVRRRRRDFALFKAIGVTRRQVSLAVAWQATITIGIAVVVGFPVGVAIGRVLWTRFANSLGVVPHPTVPLLTLTFVALGVLAVANLIAAFPGRAGSRTQPAAVLRSE